MLYFHGYWDFFRYVGRLEATGRRIWFGLKNRTKSLREEWKIIQDAKLEKERFEMEAEQKQLESEAEQKQLKSEAEEKRLREKREAEEKRLEKERDG